MNQPCGCCAGIQIVTPEPEANRPGLSAIAYRMGTQATFFETMLARLSSIYFDVPALDGSGKIQRIFPLNGLVLSGGKFERVSAGLSTRELNDPSIALLDAWATVADVLTFYQERIANEGYLGTATERRSILELAKLIGYKLRPGVSASVFLAFTVSNGFTGTIPAGTRAQSIPGTGQMPQLFETSADLAARDVWNDLGMRLTRPQVITLASDSAGNPLDLATDARTRDTLYLQGVSTNLKAGDPLLIVLGDITGSAAPQQVVRYIESVDAQTDQNRTEVTLQEMPEFPSATVAKAVANAVQPFIDDASAVFAGSDLASQVADILANQLLANVPPGTDSQTATDFVNAILPQLQEKHDIAAKRRFTRLEPWIANIIQTLQALIPAISDKDTGGGGGALALVVGAAEALAPSALANLAAILGPLAQPPSAQPPNSVRLAHTIAQTFSPQADTAPRLLAAFQPAVATTIYRAWAGVETPSSQVQVFALRAKAAPYGNNVPMQAMQTQKPTPGGPAGSFTYSITPQEWNLSSTDNNGLLLSLDSTYDKIVPNSWVVIQRTDSTAPVQPYIVHATKVQSVSRADYGMAGRVTQLRLDLSWLNPAPAVPVGSEQADISVLRGATVWAQSEALDLAEEPLDRDVEGNTIELAELYDGLETGRWIIVSGERTDIPNTTGVTASELVMISGVTQGSQEPLCGTFPTALIPPAGSLPFTQVFYTSDPDVFGDRLVVGSPAMTLAALQAALGSQPPAFNQKYCDQVQLAPGVYVNAYVPSAAELGGTFSDFASVLQDPFPNSSNPIKNGVIPAARIDPSQSDAVFAWRISTEPVHTILTLANTLAYSYDSSTVTIYGNVAKATHGQTVGEVLGNGDGSQSLQKFTLSQSPLTYLPAPTPAGAASTLVVRVNEVEWHEADNLAGLGPRDRDYITQTDDAAKTSITFGTGDHGARLPSGSANVKATYRYGIGSPGNVDAEQISQLASQPLGLKGVINPLRASGGADADSCDQARRNAPLAVEALDRLVSVDDYAEFARTYAGIGKASSARITDGRRLVVHVTIVGAEDIPIDPSSDLYLNFIQSLHQNGDPYVPIQVVLRKLKLLVISAGVKVLADYKWESVEPNIRAALLDTFGFDRRDLGQSAFLGEVISTIQTVEGVSYVNVTTFDSVAEDVTAAQLALLADPKSGLQLRGVVEAYLAQVDPTQTDPAQRIAPAELAIVTPDIPDTVILTQITT